MSNQVVIAGNLTKNIDVRKTKNGTSVANFTVMVNEEYIGKDGEKVRNAIGIPCEIWGFGADNMSGLTTKDKIVVLGSLKTFVREEGGKPEVCVKALNVSVVPYKGKSVSSNTVTPSQQETLEVVGASSNSSDIPF